MEPMSMKQSKKRSSDLLDYRPKHVMIADIFREQILSGTFRRGDKLRPDSELAKKHGVNKRTVAAGLQTLVKEGLLERAPRRGTIVVEDRASLLQTSNAVGVVMVSKGEVFADMCRHLARHLTEAGLFPVLINNDLYYDGNSISTFLERLREEPVPPYGYIIDGCAEFPYDYFRNHLDHFANSVFINRFHWRKRFDTVRYALVDYREAGWAIAEHLLARGHRRILQTAVYEPYYGGPCSSIQATVHEGFTGACRAAGVQPEDDLFWQMLHGMKSWQQVLDDLAAASNLPTALFGHSDSFISQEVVPFLEARDCHRDIELLGFYNTHLSQDLHFSSVSIHERQIAETAVAMLTGECHENETMIQPELIVRIPENRIV